MENQVKIVMLGDSGTGKTCIINRLLYNKFDINSQPSTSSNMAGLTLKIPGTSYSIRCQIWDTAGQEEYRALTSMYFKDAKASIVVFDITRTKSFEGAKEWINAIKDSQGEDIALSLIHICRCRRAI
eukprot:TRINITY_DN736_c0_g3_i6.p2 TRINITY_DN736_c0_g3~~TRINITY_DN736_c0_g3_i6.p2  ORF type:complete len:127 (+),score=36.48 TRINITY_DN736_c0_g3_i6:109-489(+)